MSNTPRTDAVLLYPDGHPELEPRVFSSFARQLEREIHELREALEVADECLALIEDAGHGAMSDNVTSARGVIDKTLNKL